MVEEESYIKVQSYRDNLRDLLHELMISKELTDITLVSDDKVQFKAHKIVLCAYSNVFKGIIVNLPKESSVIYLQGIHHQELEAILEFMYFGEATFQHNRKSEFINVSKNLELKDINEDIEYDILFDYKMEPDLKNEIDKNVGEVNQDPLQIKYFQMSGRKENGCDKLKFKTTKHKSLNHPKKSKQLKYLCNQCDFKAVRKDHLIRHMERHEGKRYPCDKCEYQATQQGTLKAHIESKHFGVKYKCNQCEKEFTLKNNLQKHVKELHQGLKRRLPCNKCDKIFSSTSHLKDHIQAKHENLKYYCDQCAYQSLYKSDLRKHIMAEHEGVTFNCNQCDFKASFREKLRKHINMNHGESTPTHKRLAYECEKCDREFKVEGIFKIHMQREHQVFT